jgi:putative hemin transport protein
MIVSELTQIKARWDALIEKEPRLRIRNAAAELGVGEGLLLATKLGEGVVRLREDFEAILKALKACGDVMALTRNDAVVSECHGLYQNVSFQGPVGLVLDTGIDLRIFINRWAYGFGVEEQGPGGKMRYSFQFFDGNGHAVHKVYMTVKSDLSAYHSILAEYTNSSQDVPEFQSGPATVARPEMGDETIDVSGFQAGWQALKDTHDFYPLLGKYRVSRTQALRLAPEGMAVKVNNSDVIRRVLDAASEQSLAIMVFVGNPGCIQIYTGEVQKVMEQGPWYNVLDDRFNLHVNEALISDAWVVRKPTADGIVTAVECYDSGGELLVQFFGKRKPGIPELEEWRTLCSALIAK